MNRLTAMVATIALAVVATASEATVYSGVRSSGGRLTWTLKTTTDGTLGVLGAGNILELQVWFSGLGDYADNYGQHPVIRSDAYNPVVLQGMSLSATRSELLFDFDRGGGRFGALTGGYYMLTAADCTFCNPGLEYLELDSEFGLRLSQSGVQLLGVVPEPANWVMLIAGFGLVGTMARRRRNALVAA